LIALVEGVTSPANRRIVSRSILRIGALKKHHSWTSFAPVLGGSETREGTSLGLTRGIAGTILYLSLCYRLGFRRARCLSLLSEAIEHILDIDRRTGHRGLPRFWGKEVPWELRPLGIQFGDPLVGFTLAVAGYRCEVEDWKREGDRIFWRGIRNPLAAASQPFLGTGAAGFAHLAFKYGQLTGEAEARREARRWLGHANALFARRFRKIERTLLRAEARQPRLDPRGRPGLLNTSLGLELVNWSHTGRIDCRWDSMLGFSNPVSGGVV
jgi:hypothetical protein